MPVYDYACACGTVTTEIRTYANRTRAARCACGKKAPYVLVRSAITVGTEVPKGDKRIIHSERQLDKHWRDKGTTGKPGGAGRKLYFT